MSQKGEGGTRRGRVLMGEGMKKGRKQPIKPSGQQALSVQERGKNLSHNHLVVKRTILFPRQHRLNRDKQLQPLRPQQLADQIRGTLGVCYSHTAPSCYCCSTENRLGWRKAGRKNHCSWAFMAFEVLGSAGCIRPRTRKKKKKSKGS